MNSIGNLNDEQKVSDEKIDEFTNLLKNGKDDEILNYVVKNMNINFKYRYYMQCLTVCGKIKVIESLIDKYHVSPLVADQYKNSLLLFAAMRGHNDLISLLIKKYKLSPRYKNVCGYTCLDVACCYKQLHTIDLLINKYNMKVDLSEICSRGHFTALKYLIDEELFRADFEDLLTIAIINNRFNIVKYIVEDKKTIPDSDILNGWMLNLTSKEIQDYLQKFIKKPIKERVFSLNKYNHEGEEECSICLEKLNKTICYKIECKHSFHTHCLIEWVFGDKKSCPLCRVDL